MKISASILAINNSDIKNTLSSVRGSYDLVHIDIADNIFCPTYGMPFDIISELNKNSNDLLDVHFMIENPDRILTKISKLNIYNLSVHCEAIDVDKFVSMKSPSYKLGIAVLVDSDLSILNDYLEHADSVLLLCVSPGFSFQKPSILPVDRVLSFRNTYPDYNGLLSVDGGVSSDMLEDLKGLNVDIAVQGGAIFGTW